MSGEISRNLHKKMRKRKDFDATSKFLLTKKTSNDVLRSSEDELFIPHPKISITKSNSSRYLLFWKHSQPILRFSLICIFMITSISLIYSNIQLKNEVQNLSLRITEIEKQFSTTDFNNILLTIEQIKIRLNRLGTGNFSYVYHQMQKLVLQMLRNQNHIDESRIKITTHEPAEFPNSVTELDNLNQENEIQKEIQIMKHNNKVQELIVRFERLTNLVYSTSNQTSLLLHEVQFNLDDVQNKMNECQCSKESNELIFDKTLLTQNIVTKSNSIDLLSADGRKQV